MEVSIIKVEQQSSPNKLLINYAIHNVCNYKCWYCFPGSNTGEHRWPALDVVANNFIQLLKYYKTQRNKSQFELNLLGGEPTLWPELGDFIKILKLEFGKDIQIRITTNASRTIRWWSEHSQYFDKVLISCHPNEADENHIIAVADLLYITPVYVDVIVLMDPTVWDKAINIVQNLKKSKNTWSIQTSQVIHNSVKYNTEQIAYLESYVKRRPNLFWYWKTSKNFNYKNKLYFDNGKVISIKKNYLLFNNLNHFKGWECNIGIDNILINFDGRLSANCGENLYKLPISYNLYDKNFVNMFHPKLVPTICTKEGCYCEHEINTTKQVIPIKLIG